MTRTTCRQWSDMAIKFLEAPGAPSHPAAARIFEQLAARVYQTREVMTVDLTTGFARVRAMYQ